MSNLFVYRVGGDSSRDIRLVGYFSDSPMSFVYDSDYLKSGNGALSLSLPLRSETYSELELLPYFDGLLPEGPTRRAISAQLGVDPQDTFSLLHLCGMDVIGDIAITSGEPPTMTNTYSPVSSSALSIMFKGYESLAEINSESRLSLAGTQGKTGLAHFDSGFMNNNWFQPINGAASTHILKVGSLPDIPYLEYLCMNAALSCGIAVPETHLLNFGRPVICVERYDREIVAHNDSYNVKRIHQEDFTQALSLTSEMKYCEAQGLTARTVAELLRNKSVNPIEDIEAFATLALFNYLVGNCDNHLKNLSILYNDSWTTFKLAPAYDLVSTTRYERFSRKMGMKIGDGSVIDEVTPHDILLFGEIVGMNTKDIREICSRLIEVVPSSVNKLGDSLPEFDALPYVAWNMVEEIYPRLEVLKQV